MGSGPPAEATVLPAVGNHGHLMGMTEDTVDP